MSEFEGSEELSPEEKQQIAQHYLLSSPPGQFHEVLTDVKRLVNPDILEESFLAGIARVFNTKYSKVVNSPTGQKILLTKAGEIDSTHYHDPIANITVLVDHMSLTTKEEGPAPTPESNELENLRAIMQLSLTAYVARIYQSEYCAAGVHLKNGSIQISITGEKANLKNFWSGRWTSSWTLDKTSSTAASIAGEIKVHAHYFEDGNLQLLTNKTLTPIVLTYDSDQTLTDLVTKYIQTQETLLQRSLQEMYGSMNEETFRSMRRIMPITRSKMEWNIHSLRMIRQTQHKKN